MKFFQIELTPYPSYVLISSDQTNQEFKKCLKRADVPLELVPGLIELPETVNARMVHFTNNSFVIRFKGKPSMATIVHESTHVVLKLFADIGLEYSPESEEAYCYLLQNLFERIVRGIDRK